MWRAGGRARYMNLFVAGWGAPPRQRASACDALRGSPSLLPQLDSSTYLESVVDRGFIASISTALDVAFPRRYVHRGREEIVLYDGMPIATDGHGPLHDAAQLARTWQDLPARLDGQFAVVRLGGEPSALELIIDPLGMSQVYVVRTSTYCIFSNSVRTLASVDGRPTLDRVGASSLLGMGWVGGDRTLLEGIRVFSGGAHRRWSLSGGPVPEVHHYFPRSALAELASSGSKAVLRPLRGALISILRELADGRGPVECPLTAGRDSRVLGCLVHEGRVAARYYTSGRPGDSDVEIGERLARRFGLPHELHQKPMSAIHEAWEECADRLIDQNDGLVSLWQLADVLRQAQEVTSLPARLWGIGGEIARGFYSDPRLLAFPQSPESVRRFLRDSVVHRAGGLLLPEGRQAAERQLDETLDELERDGFNARDLPDAFYAFERTRRWGGSNARKVAPECDFFSPFCTRPFLQAAFCVPAADRWAETLHHGLLEMGDPGWLSIPFEKRWRSRWVRLELAQWVARRLREKFAGRFWPPSQPELVPDVPYQIALLEQHRHELAGRCLDHAGSPAWDILDRALFEEVVRRSEDAERRRMLALPIWNAITLLLYGERVLP